MFNQVDYRGKHFDVPDLTFGSQKIHPEAPTQVLAKLSHSTSHEAYEKKHPILKDLNTVWNLEKFKTPRTPIHIAHLENQKSQEQFSKSGAVNVLDLPLKFPGSEFRIPQELSQFLPIIQLVANYESLINRDCYDEYYCYATVDQKLVKAGSLQREAPCHVDGFQGALWKPKVKINHTYVISDSVPTTYYLQPFDFSGLDEAKHNFFWEMNYQVAQTNSQYAWQPKPFELNLIDAYTVHRGSPSPVDVVRTWLRLSFEVRIFNRLGNAHNPMFSYDWDMIPRDIEGLNLIAYHTDSDPSLRVFPHQKIDGTPHESRKTRTQPNLKPRG